MQVIGAWSSGKPGLQRLKASSRPRAPLQCRHRVRIAREGRRSLTVEAFIPQQDSKRLDAFPTEVEFSALLGLQEREGNLSETHIMAAYEHLASSPLESGYSKQVEDGRIVLLHAAVDGCRNLRALALQSEWHSLAVEDAKQAMVQWWLLPAALSLLQETEQSETVLKYGKEALSRREAQPYKADILFSMALAHCSFASKAFDEEEQVRVGYAHLEEALALLEEAKLADGKLASEIQEGLRQLKPDCVIEHLRFSEGEEQKGSRSQAIKVLKSLLANPALAIKEDGSTAISCDFVKQSMLCLSSIETVNLLDWQDIATNGANISWYFEGLLRRGIIAHIVAGFAYRRPDLVEKGANLLATQSTDMLLESVVCCVLLADTQAASDILIDADGRGFFQQEEQKSAVSKESEASSKDAPPESADALPSPGEILQYIRSNSPQGDYDLLPGLVIFTEQWLTQVGFQRFKDTADDLVLASLNSYYAEEKVTTYLSVKARDNDSIKASILVMTENLKHSFSRLLDAPVSSRTSRNQETTLPRVPVPGSLAPSLAKSAHRPWLETAAKLIPQGGQQLAICAVLFGAVCMAGAIARRPRPAIGTASMTTSLDIDSEEMQQSTPAKLWQWRAPWQQNNKAPKLKTRAAEACIRRWQVAKALAMGPRHDDALLEDIIAEPYLSKVKKDIAVSKKAGWFWSFRLSDLHVENVENVEEEDGFAIATARLREKGDLFAITGKRADAHCYDNSYSAEYQMLRQPDNSWRISNVLVVGED